MIGRFVSLSIAMAITAAAPPARSASLNVAPISIEIVEPASTGAVTLRNHGERPLNVQVRLFRWTQVDGADRLEPTDDVVASPPIVTINAGADYVVRLQRIAQSAAQSEETYRTVIDELPDPNRQRNGSIAIVLRYLVPTFFMSPDASQPRLSWSIARRGGATVLAATNSGDKRIQIIDLRLMVAKGRSLMVGKGLAGYVLGHSARAWTLPSKAGAVSGGVVVAASDHGPISAPVSP